MSIEGNIEQVRKQIAKALTVRQARGLGTYPVKLVAVTKNQNAETVKEALQAGVASIGENRVQEALSKQAVIGRTVEWHLIGHLQTNKAKQAVRSFDLIHSVDSERLAVALSDAASQIGKTQKVLLQVNVARDENKFGIEAGDTERMAKLISSLDGLELAGLMTIVPYYENPADARPLFRQMYELFTRLRDHDGARHMKWLSMGMTNDYQVAIEEGANLVRIGTAIFGPRQY